jgi:prolyl-tRNA synthetase
VRWEFKHPTPFLRTREFLWQEGHTAFASVEEADREVFDILDLYARVYEQLLAVPVIKGRKSEKEKFAGGRFTTTVEAFIPGSHRAIQGATSHSLGQNFARMCNISFEGERKVKTEEELALEATTKTRIKELEKQMKDLQQEVRLMKGKDPATVTARKEKAMAVGTFRKEHKALKLSMASSSKAKLAWQNSWGLTTRTIGVMVMVHSDDTGLVLPPRIAPTQVVVIVIPPAKADDQPGVLQTLMETARELTAALVEVGVRAVHDSNTNKKPGWKYHFHAQRGVPLRLELGSNDLKSLSVLAVRRVDGSRASIPIAKLPEIIPNVLEAIQAQMLASARHERDANIAIAYDWETFCKHIGDGKLVLAPWCELIESEEWVKETTKIMFAPKKEGEEQDDGRSLNGAAKSLCLPFSQPPMPEGQLCFTGNGKPATGWCMWGRSY